MRKSRINDLIKRRGVLCSVVYPESGTPIQDYMVIVLAGGRRPRDPKEYLRYGEVAGDNNFQDGDVVSNTISDERFLIVNDEPQYHSGEVVWSRLQLYKCNVVADFYRKSLVAGPSGGATTSFTLEVDSVPACLYAFEFVDKQRSYGLDSFIKRRLYITSNFDLYVDDRVVINSTNYRISYLDAESLPGVYSCILQDENR